MRVLAALHALLGWLAASYPPPRRHLGYLALIIVRVGVLALSTILTGTALLLAALGLRRQDYATTLLAAAAVAVFTPVTMRQTKPLVLTHRIPSPPPLTRRLRPFLPGSAPCQHNITIRTDGRYTLKADLWLPPASQSPSGMGIVYLHPSSWHYLDKDLYHGTRPLFRHLARQGHVVLDVAYAMPPRVKLPGMMHDVYTAIAWLKKEGTRYGVLPHKVVAMGGSAGGHLALLAGYAPTYPAWQQALAGSDTAVAGVISLYGISDLTALQRHIEKMPHISHRFEPLLKIAHAMPTYGRIVNTPDMLPNLLGATLADQPEAYQHGSPISHVSASCPPTLLLFGSHDFGAPPAQNRRLFQALAAANAAAMSVEIPYADHMFDVILPNITPAMTTAVSHIDHFLTWLNQEITHRYVN